MITTYRSSVQQLVKGRVRVKKAVCVPVPPGHNGTHPTNAVDTPTEGIVLDINEESGTSQSMLFKLQESTGFAKDVLSRVEEDVWNGI